jgi:hypothetical protein
MMESAITLFGVAVMGIGIATCVARWCCKRKSPRIAI